MSPAHAVACAFPGLPARLRPEKAAPAIAPRRALRRAANPLRPPPSSDRASVRNDGKTASTRARETAQDHTALARTPLYSSIYPVFLRRRRTLRAWPGAKTPLRTPPAREADARTLATSPAPRPPALAR